MKREDLKNTSTEQLLKQQKTTRFVIGLFMGALVASLAINLYTTGFSSQLITPLALLPLLLVIRNSLTQIH